MSGKRILDVIALLRVSRNIAYNHFAIRFSQVDLFSKTSSLVKFVQGRTAPGFAAPSQHFARGAGKSSPDHVIPNNNDVSGAQTTEGREGPGQDHHYDRSFQHSTQDPAPGGTIHVKQEEAKRQPLPDGTLVPTDSPVDAHKTNAERPGSPFKVQSPQTISAESAGSTPNTDHLSSEEAKHLQRSYEAQIPQRPAQPPSSTGFGGTPGYKIEQDGDVYYQPEGVTKPVLSALPRVKVPKNENDVQAGDPHLPKDINADVYYAGAKKESQGPEPDEETLSQLFHSPKASRLLRRPPGSAQSRRFHAYARSMQQQNSKAEQEELKKLAADMAKDVDSGSVGTASQSTSKPYEMRESQVPSSRAGRIWEFGGLAASMAYGAVSESITRSGGANGSLMLSPGNLERLVAKLSKMRGAALKLGQMISFQDVKMLPKPIHDVLQRVQDSADYMPIKQRDQVIAGDLGPNWRDLFQSFDDRPIAAASIGQVHGAVLKDGQPVAVKVQYPGVAASISSDLNNLSLLLTASRLLPKGLYLDKTIANARTELAWECDYVREAQAAKRFRELLADDTDVFAVPRIMESTSGKQVLTMERMEGIAVTKIHDLSQEKRDWIGTHILRLCFREIMEFHYMQSDPNWTNFFYNEKTNKLVLLDFGASREYPERFIKLYVQVLEAASRNDRKAVGDLSVELGYLTGYESKAMLNAHIDSVLTLAEPYKDSAPDVFNFQDQTITDRVRALIPVMVKERLAPPPEETYSLHRKLSGAFLLCARLGSRVRCKELFQQGLSHASKN